MSKDWGGNKKWFFHTNDFSSTASFDLGIPVMLKFFSGVGWLL